MNKSNSNSGSSSGGSSSDNSNRDTANIIKGALLAEALWDIMVEGIADGDLDELKSVEQAFKAGVMSAIGLGMAHAGAFRGCRTDNAKLSGNKNRK